VTRVLDGVTAVHAAAGTHLGHSAWLTVSAERTEAFGRAASPDLAYLALSLTNCFLPEIVEVRGFSSGVNYGTDAVRFGPPVAAGDRVRAGAELVEATDVKGALQTLIRITVEVDGRAEPACVVDSLSRWLP